ncbi:AraC family transcriptional regulator, partial [Salmonella enterica subsp. enterica serovar Oranienburg]|nr:AraC family transcriptional regulator [Salmonella enterica subsp. enterica serovar Oranienburg]
MINIKELSAAHCEGLNEWGNTIKKELGFSDAKVKTPSGVEPDLFLGQMSVDKLNNGILKIKIYSSSQQTDLVHKDCLLGLKKRIFIVNTCGSMLIRNEKNRKIICPGDSVIVPSWSSVIEESFSRRTSLSFIIDISTFADSYDQVKSLLWKNVSELTYGVEINKIISNFYNNNSDRFCEKNMSA